MRHPRSRGVSWRLHQALAQRRSARPLQPGALVRQRHKNEAQRTANRRAERADRRILCRLDLLLDDNNHYNAHYPAAVQVRDQLGVAKWRKFERNRRRILNFAVRMRKLDREKLEVDPATVDPHMPKVFGYIQRTYGPHHWSEFIDLHERVRVGHLAELQLDYPVHTEIDARFPMNAIRDMLMPKPYMWFLYNLYFPKTWRMTWPEQQAWAIGTLTTPIAERFPVGTLQSPDGIPPSYCEVRSRALLEAFIDIRRSLPHRA